MTPRYIIASGYHDNPGSGMDWFHRAWAENTVKYAKPSPERIFVIADSGHAPSDTPVTIWDYDPGIDYISLDGDLGNCGQILDGSKPYFMPTCPAVWMAGMWLAYLNECDFVYKEQDTLCFGDWVGEMYRQIGDKQAIFGTASNFGISTVAFLVKHEWIPMFVHHYLSWRENSPKTIAEHKVKLIEDHHRGKIARHNFGYDGDRPFDPTAKVFTVQKLTPDDLRLLAKHGLVDITGMPTDVALFSNHNQNAR